MCLTHQAMRPHMKETCHRDVCVPCFVRSTSVTDFRLLVRVCVLFSHRNADLIVEVAHPDIVRDYGAIFLQSADLMVSSVDRSSPGEDILQKNL